MAPYADIVWMETPTASVDDAADLIHRVRKFNKNVLLAYNLSPSFNWSQYEEDYIKKFSDEIGKLGYVYQFCTLGGFHATALSSELFSRRYSKEAIYAFHDMI